MLTNIPTKSSSEKFTKEKLLEAAFSIIREKGYSSTTVDDLCREAKVTKGTFFHYFMSKEDLAVSAANHWSTVTGELFRNAPYHQHQDPLDRVLGYIKFRRDILQGQIPEFPCLVGTMVQETYNSNPDIRDACYQSIFGHSAALESDIQKAKDKYSPNASWTAKSLALHTQAVLQGSFILAKASNQVEVAIDGVDHLKNYIQLLFSKTTKG